MTTLRPFEKNGGKNLRSTRMQNPTPVLYATVLLLVVSCAALPNAEKFDPAQPLQLKRHQSLPEIRKSKFDWDFDLWASRVRAMREDKSGYRKSDSNLERHVLLDGNEHKEPSRKEVSPLSNPFQRLIEMPLWQTSLLSAKYIMNHESDVVTYRERTFPTARQVPKSEASLSIRLDCFCLLTRRQKVRATVLS